MSQARRQRRRQRSTRGASPSRVPSYVFPRSALWISVGLVALIGVAYASVARYGFLRFDDPQYVTENPHVANGLTPEAMSWALTSGYAANWHPLTWMSHMLDIQLFGMNASAHHVVNVAIHSASTVLWFSVLWAMTGAVWRSAFVAGLFGLHPIHVESVAWIAERKDVLSAFFWMLTIGAYLFYVRRPRPARYLLVVASFALGLMSKPMVVTLPFALLLLDYWPLGRFSASSNGRPLSALLIEKVPLLALSAASSVITFLVQREGGAVAVGTRLPIALRVENAVVSYASYLGKTFWPAHLAAYYPYPQSFSLAVVLASAIGLAAVTGAVVWRAREHPYLPVGWFWYLGTLVPAIGLVQVGTQAMADRYTYLPLIGIFIIIAWGAPELVSRWAALPRQALVVAAVAGILVCTVVAKAQVRHWESSSALWTHALAVTTDNYAAHTYMGNALANQGDLRGAIAHYNEAIRILPDYPEAHNNLGPALARTGRLDEAVAQFTEAIRLRPNYVDAQSNLGLALASQGKLQEAIPHYKEALRLDPDHAGAHGNLGFAYRALGRTADAIQEFETSLRLNPNNPDVRAALAELKPQTR